MGWFQFANDAQTINLMDHISNIRKQSAPRTRGFSLVQSAFEINSATKSNDNFD